MKTVIQRVNQASVNVDGETVGKIEKGLVVLLGVHKDDRVEDIPWMINKILNLRIFSDEKGKMNLSLKDIKGAVLVVSQFTLYGNCLNGRRPDFLDSASGDTASVIYNHFCEAMKQELGQVQTGIFGADMQVALINDGPVTFIIEGKEPVA
jgi:D-aminoacyl-tRNA deacylase